MTLALSVLVLIAIALPHIMVLDRASPVAAASIWLSGLALRALAVLLASLAAILFVSRSTAAGAVTHWCWHEVLPILTDHFALNGHQLGSAATLGPSFALGLGAIGVVLAVWRSARAVRRLVRRSAVGAGPSDSVIVPGPEVMLAAAGIARPTIVVSAGALAMLDDQELAAGIDHERGHIVRRHRYVLLAAELCRVLGHVVPGSGRAMRELVFHLERDADQWALSRDHDPLALASAICKAAAPGRPVATLSPLGGGGGATRVRQLVEDVRPGTDGRGPLGITAVAMVTLTIAIAGLVPPIASAGLAGFAADSGTHHCPS